LIRQRIRWNLGYLETFLKEKEHYFKQAFRFTRMGMRLWLDLLVFSFLVFLPVIAVVLAFLQPLMLLFLLLGVYLFCVIMNTILFLRSPKETTEIRQKGIFLIFVYPVMKLTVEYCGWMGALMRLLKKK
jgi:cellulose synthase/poly-beta-1,6-N-acetylglucosamine synthase-like glycosyltransferase